MAKLLENKKATFNYEILEKFEAGIELLGLEVKSLRARKGTLAGGYISVRGGEVYLRGIDLPPYQPSNTPDTYDPKRERKLLLTKKEIGKREEFTKQKGLTIVPLSVYNKGRNLKLEFAVVRGKKKHDKREVIKKRETERDIRRTLKRIY